VKITFIRQHLQGRYPITVCCRVLGVSTSAYYDSIARSTSARAIRTLHLADAVLNIHTQLKGIYGSPRMTRELNRRGIPVCRNTVARLMAQSGCRSRRYRRFRHSTTDSSGTLAPAPNLLNQQFDQATGPNQIWGADITVILIGRHKAYLAVVMDLYSRYIVGWCLGTTLEASLAEAALRRACASHRPAAGTLHHSDQGSQYASQSYRRVLEHHGMIQSMSRKGNCYDNAPLESFFATIKLEMVPPQGFDDLDHAADSIFGFIEGFYNTRRIHTSIAPHTPAQRQYSHA